ncbi:hypothetical protein [uncultured Acetobacteroides sp.]|uniref:hypothetical protein n=1 Tax=uncultured Acetobacteroides sp. TaxID=1760811 RepID=UPI0029F57F88|nr:hypothetical protein [uncultured Acetobacteroides sp.]
MDSDPQENKQNLNGIIDILQLKTNIKQKVYDNTFEVFNQLKEMLHELTNDINEELSGVDRRVKLEYRDRGKFEAEIRIAEDILIFSMHTNVFQFDRDHQIWKTSYVEQDKLNALCGVINIYNFLTDSFKYNRLDDLGYLIGRIFINKDLNYFVEGKRQMAFLYSNFGNSPITPDALKKIIETAIVYSLEFDLLVPPYDTVKIASVAQMNTKIENSKMQTGKRLGYKFNSDDVNG